MRDSLSDLVDNIDKEINKNKRKDYIVKCLTSMEENCKTKNRDYKCYLEYVEKQKKQSNKM